MYGSHKLPVNSQYYKTLQPKLSSGLSQMDFILASQSKTRCCILRNAALPFCNISPNIDELNIMKSLVSEGTPHRDIPNVLAEFKAKKISSKNIDSWVLGCDQILSLDGEVFSKPDSKAQLSANISQMAGKTHQLITANVIYKGAKPMWRHTAVSNLTMHPMSPLEVQNFVTKFWLEAQNSSAGYCFEKTPHLFSKVKGNWFDIMGISISQILNFLHQNNYANIATTPKIVAVLGSPISHSRSPIMHRYWLQKNNICGDYIAIDTPEKNFSNTVNVLAEVGVSGFNVTLPHKEAALNLSHSKTKRALEIGAANTLIVDSGGNILADNTDGYGFISNLEANGGSWLPNAGPALVMGAGGAARAILVSLLAAGTPQIYLTNRTKSRAQNLSVDLSDKIEVIDWDKKEEWLSRISTLVNTTSLGMTGKPALTISLKTLNKKALVTDLVYTPVKTPLLTQAEKLGFNTVSGVGMLLYQGVPGFHQWFGLPPKVDLELIKLVSG